MLQTQESYTRIGIRINWEHTPEKRVSEFVRKMGYEILAAELIDKCRAILEFAKTNTLD